MALLLSFGITGCNSDDEKKYYELEMVRFMGLSIPYDPIEISEMPTWLSSYITTALNGIEARICQGQLEDENIYSVYAGFMSSDLGYIYDQQGNKISHKTDNHEFVESVKNWRCIYKK